MIPEWIKIFSKLQSWPNLQITKCFHKLGRYLYFKNTPVLIKSKSLGCILVEWKNFNWYVKINEFNQNYWFSKNSSQDQSFLHIVDWRNLEFYDFHVWNIKEKPQLKDQFSHHLLKGENEPELIIPMINLCSASFNEEEVLDIINHENKCDLIKEFWNDSNFSTRILIQKYLDKIDEFTSIHAKINLIIIKLTYKKENYFYISFNYSNSIIEFIYFYKAT